MESSSHFSRDCANEGEKRAGKVRTRAQTKKMAQQEAEREQQKQGLSQDAYWEKYVRSEADIVRFYSIYYPGYPDCLAKSIAARVAGIIEKSRQGLPLTQEEAGYYHRSMKPNPEWDPLAELEEQKMQGQIHVAAKRMSDLLGE